MKFQILLAKEDIMMKLIKYEVNLGLQFQYTKLKTFEIILIGT